MPTAGTFEKILTALVESDLSDAARFEALLKVVSLVASQARTAPLPSTEAFMTEQTRQVRTLRRLADRIEADLPDLQAERLFRADPTGKTWRDYLAGGPIKMAST